VIGHIYHHEKIMLCIFVTFKSKEKGFNTKVNNQRRNVMLTNLYCKVSTFLTTFKNDECGVTAIEYGLIAAAMGGVLIAAFYGSENDSITASLGNAFEAIRSALDTAYGTIDDPS
jgi:pilus assembly protein Flp/PilA